MGGHGLGQRLVGVWPAPQGHRLRVEEELEGRHRVTAVAARLQGAVVGDAVGGEVDRVEVALGRGIESGPDRRGARDQGEPGWVQGLGAGDKGLGSGRGAVGDRAGRRPRVLGIEEKRRRLVVGAGLEPDVDSAGGKARSGLQGPDRVPGAGRRRQGCRARPGIGVVAGRRDIEVEGRGAQSAGGCACAEREAQHARDAEARMRPTRPTARLAPPAKFISEHT